jgi:hypothetical protein
MIFHSLFCKIYWKNSLKIQQFNKFVVINEVLDDIATKAFLIRKTIELTQLASIITTMPMIEE